MGVIGSCSLAKILQPRRCLEQRFLRFRMPRRNTFLSIVISFGKTRIDSPLYLLGTMPSSPSLRYGQCHRPSRQHMNYQKWSRHNQDQRYVGTSSSWGREPARSQRPKTGKCGWLRWVVVCKRPPSSLDWMTRHCWSCQWGNPKSCRSGSACFFCCNSTSRFLSEKLSPSYLFTLLPPSITTCFSERLFGQNTFLNWSLTFRKLQVSWSFTNQTLRLTYRFRISRFTVCPTL